MKKKILLVSVIFIASFCYSQNNYVRKNANSPEAQADLEAMNIAFKKMREMGCENGLAWYYQGAIHNIPEKINGPNILCSEYQSSDDKLFAWGNCTHKRNSEPATLNFLLWHRMYTWHLEKIVRKLSGKKDFALPYWNYGSEKTIDNVMPEKMRDKSGSLYESARYSILNNGDAISTDDVENIKYQLNELKKNDSFEGSAGFSKKLEGSPHGFMHTYIGGGYSSETFYNKIYQKKDFSGLMAEVKSAGFDPIFWLHHSMVDRIWESWDNTSNGKRPTLNKLESNPWVYNFIEPNGDQITYTIKEMYDIVFNLDYSYDSLLYTSETPSAILASASPSMAKKVLDQDTKSKTIWTQEVNKVLGTTNFVHKITKRSARKTNKLFKSIQKKSNLESLDENISQIILNLEVVLYKEPSDYYTVYLKYSDKEEYVGVMTFFGVAHDHGEGENHTIGENGVKLNFSFYVSDDLISSDKNFDVVIKKNGDGDAKVTLENISMIKQN